MAISDWDCLAFDLTGPALDPDVTNAEGVTVGIFKNSLQVRQQRTRRRWWQSVEPDLQHHTVANIRQSDLTVGGWRIRAERGPQRGIYVVATSAVHRASLSADRDQWHDKALLVGCGVYGHADPADTYAELAKDEGVDPDTLLVTTNASGRHLKGVRDGQVVTLLDDPDIPYIGVTVDAVERLCQMVDEVAVHDHPWPDQALRAINWDHARRVNQGELVAGSQVANPTTPGAAEPPLLDRVLSHLGRS